jgi:hypothetical protein
MTDLRRGDFRDPAVIVEERQSRTCAGCIYLRTDKLFNTAAVACRKRKRKAELCIEKMKRCELYDDGSKQK